MCRIKNKTNKTKKTLTRGVSPVNKLVNFRIKLVFFFGLAYSIQYNHIITVRILSRNSHYKKKQISPLVYSVKYCTRMFPTRAKECLLNYKARNYKFKLLNFKKFKTCNAQMQSTIFLCLLTIILFAIGKLILLTSIKKTLIK